MPLQVRIAQQFAPADAVALDPKYSESTPRATPALTTSANSRDKDTRYVHEERAAAVAQARLHAQETSSSSKTARADAEPADAGHADAENANTQLTAAANTQSVESRSAVAIFDSAQYLPVTALDLYPMLSASIPEAAFDTERMSSWQGVVRMSLWIDEHGIVTKAEIIDAEPAKLFDETLVDTYKKAQFVPGQRDGLPVRSKLILELQFTDGLRRDVLR